MRFDQVPGAPEPISEVAPPLERPHLLRQRWLDVTFLHWAVSPASVAPHLPAGTHPDVIDGRTFAGLVLFRMAGTAVGRGPAVPWLGTFLETNVRLYSVDDTGRRGVVFLSLDADRALPVLAGRIGFGLPYRWARMRHRVHRDKTEPAHEYTARRRPLSAGGDSVVVVRPGKPSCGGPLESFLTARWGLHVRHCGKTWFLPNAHEQWPLRTAQVLGVRDGLVGAAGFPEIDGREPDHAVFSEGVTARFGRPVRLPG